MLLNMFSTNGHGKSTASTMKSKPTAKNGSTMPSVNMISEGTHLKGSLKTKNDIRIAGTLEGEIKSSGKLIISSSGHIDGDVKAVDADIAGTLDGEIRVNNKLILRKTATINGDIYTKNLIVEEGAQINGACRMGEQQNTSVSIDIDEGKQFKESTLKAVETR